MIMELDFTGDVPIYLQIRNQVVLGIARGELKIGETLPTVRQLASDIGVNPMTVNKAYAILRQDGLIQTDRRQGTQVCEFQKEKITESFYKNLELVLAEAVVYKLGEDDIEQLIFDIFKNFNQRGGIK